MSRIVNQNFITKLESILEEFDFSDNLKSLIDFFEEQVIIDQSRKGSKKVFSVKDFNLLKQIKEFSEIKRILAYLNKLINSFDGKYLQIHLNTDLEDSVSHQIIFLLTWDALINSTFDDSQLKKDIEVLELETNRPLIMPSNNNKHLSNQIFREAKGKKFRKKFLQKISTLTGNSINNGWLININKGAYSIVLISEFSQFPKSEGSYVNFGNSRKNIFKEMGREKVERLSNIINLFPSITGKNIWYKDFMRDEINRYNNFKKVITITSGEKTAEALLDMQKQNKFQAEEIYTIFPFEVEYKDYEN